MLFCPKDGPLSNYDRPNLHYDRANLREVPSALHISTVVMAKRTVVIVENARKSRKSGLTFVWFRMPFEPEKCVLYNKYHLEIKNGR